VSLALLTDLPIGAIERTLVLDHSDQVLLLAKAIDLSWDTTKAILQVRAASESGSANELELNHARFMKLTPETARTAIQFYRLRERATKAPLN
jgi:hypothetical protein